MKMKLTTLLFGLLLAVGWTSSASAQALPEGGWTKRMNLPEAGASSAISNSGESIRMLAPAHAPKRVTGESNVVHNKAYYDALEYKWVDANNVTHTSKATDVATDPYQIYELMRFVYGNPKFPGPTYNAYLPNREREDPVTYNAVGGGWNITTASNTNRNIAINITHRSSSSGWSNTYYAVYVTSITVKSGDDEIAKLEYSEGMESLPDGWTNSDNNLAINNNGEFYFYTEDWWGNTIAASGGTINIDSSLLNGYNNVTVEIKARLENANYAGSISINNESKTITSTTTSPYTWSVTLPEEGAFVQGTVVAPIEDGYTVLVVALNNDITKVSEGTYNSSYFTTKAQIINYFRNNIDFVKLLTDGLRIGEGLGTGTVFNCDGRYNKFFFLGKGQARKKAPWVTERINNGTFQSYCGEDVPFKEMFEQFSPTSTAVAESSQTLDFFDKMREGNVYSLIHDCPSIIQTGHQFSLSGNSGTDYYAFSGLNFFVPDYRLLWWQGKDDDYPNALVDGRDSDPYQRSDASTGLHGSNYRTPSNNNYYYWSSYYTNYNQKYAPKIGIYRITLDAEATQVGTSHNTNNHNYNVTLTWISSLNQMSGSIVPQTYTVYLVDENGNRTQLEPEGVKFYDIYGNELDAENQNPFHRTQVVYAVPQNEHSYTIEYQVDGVADQGPAFHATSNRASVVIPGWNDFVGLQLDHHESDFVITKNQQTGQSSERDNWYRNFVAMVNEDIVNGLTVSKITGDSDDGVEMNEFNLYRFLYNDQGNPVSETKVATIKFDKNDASTEQVKFNVTYYNQQIEDYTLKYKNGNQNVEVANAYNRDKMGIPESGYVRVKGNGDIVIWPNSYDVNIRSIKVYENGTSTNTVASWTAPSNMTWYVSPGSKWEPYTSESNVQVGYMEGGGYIAILDVLNTYPNARVEIEAFVETGTVGRISVNDNAQTISATSAGTTYTWISPQLNAAPRRAGETQTITESFEDVNVFTAFTLGDITATQHTGHFGDWKVYDSTGAHTWGMSNLTWTNMEEPQAWMPFNGDLVPQADAHTGKQYIESASPWTTEHASNYNSQNGTSYLGADKADSWLISPQLSGNAQTITFYERIFSEDYKPETYEVLVSMTNNDPESFTLVQSFESDAIDWTLRSASLPEGAKYFAIRHTSSSEKFGMMIDDVTYEITNEAPVAESGLLRLHLLMADQLKQEIFDDNSHPDAYGYVLRWEQPTNPDDRKQSGTVRVNIQKTDCEVEGYYTLDEIDNDKNIGSVQKDNDGKVTAIQHDQGLTMNVLTADVEFNLSSSNELLNYYNLQSEKDQEPSFNEDYVTKLYRQGDFTYREMLETSPEFNEVYPSGLHHYFDDSTPIKTGYYGNGNRFVSYAPSVSTWGIDRRYFEYDGLDNTYGGPVWKTAVGQAKLNSVTAERQTNKNNSVNWTTAAGPASLYILDGIEAEGYLPQPALTKVEFEPYMFRIFVESKNGKLRPYKTVDAVEGSATQGEHLDALVPDDQLTDAQKYGPQCVWNGYVKYNEETGAMITDDSANGATIKRTVKTDANGNDTEIYYTYNKDKVDRPDGYDDNNNPLGPWNQDAFNAMFGALDAMTLDDNKLIIQDDLKFFVRFYYCVKGHSVGHTPLNRDAEADRPGNGSESAGQSGGSATAVSEITYLGEIVSQTYFNVQGMESDKPFDGVNIVVTRFSDGTTSVSKVVR